MIINHFHPYRGYKQTCDLRRVEEKDKRNVARCKCVNYCTWRNEIVLEKTESSNKNFENKFCFIGIVTLEKRLNIFIITFFKTFLFVIWIKYY